MAINWTGQPRYEIADAWTERIIIQIEGWRTALSGQVRVVINGIDRPIDPAHPSLKAIKARKALAVVFPFDQQLVTDFSVEVLLAGVWIKCKENGELSSILFQHSKGSVLQNIQRRGALKEGKGIQLVCALQAYLWAESTDGVSALSGEGEQLRAQSVAYCSSVYRLLQNSNECSDTDLALRRARAKTLLDGADLGGTAARWYPSIKLALAQLLLMKGDLSACTQELIEISDHQEVIMNSEPICAFNISLANCLLSAILRSQRDARYAQYRDRWQYIFRTYPAKMDIRFGTMEEFEKIYQACMLNYRFQLQAEKCKDKRFSAPTLDEVVDVCFRVNVTGGARKGIIATISGG